MSVTGVGLVGDEDRILGTGQLSAHVETPDRHDVLQCGHELSLEVGVAYLTIVLIEVVGAVAELSEGGSQRNGSYAEVMRPYPGGEREGEVGEYVSIACDLAGL